MLQTRPSVAVRVNQTGYRPQERKTALALTQANLDGQKFTAITDGGDVVLEGQVGADRGPYGNFSHLYELDFSALQAPGKYQLMVGEAQSPAVAVGDEICKTLISPTLDFFKTQRCGEQPANLHGPCHLEDGVASGGPLDGQPMNATGGWHDAGDYLKFMVTSSYATMLMLTSWQRHPEAFAGDAVPKVLQEARVGLDWMTRMWDGKNQVLYYQVGDESDHDGWRMPEEDVGARPVWACDPQSGANLAGMMAGSLALAATIWSDPTRAWYNPALAAKYLLDAEQIYAWGKQNPNPQSTNPSDFYHASGSKDHMALAAAELYRATGRDRYLQEAKDFATEAGSAPFDEEHVHALAHYEIARLDPTYVATAAAALDSDLQPLGEHARTDPFHAALTKFTWGSVEFLIGSALEAKWYEDITGDDQYRDMAQQQRDYVLGCNPWGTSLVSGAGAVWPHHPHHQIADLTQADIPGIWTQGPCNLSAWNAQHITLTRPDDGADFQTDAAVFHDDVADYVTNEPTINTNALGLALASWYAQDQGAAAECKRRCSRQTSHSS